MRYLLLTALLLAGCATLPKTAWLDPQAPAVTQASSSLVPIRFDFQDNRADQTVLFLPKGNVSSDPGLDERLASRLRQGLKAHGYSVQPGTGARLSVRLISVEAVVTEGMASHSSKQKVVMEAYAERDGQTMTKRFTSTGSFEAPLGPDLGRLEQELNNLLEQNMGSLINDPELTRLFSA